MKDGEHVEERFHEKLNRFLTVSTVLQNTLLLINLKKSFSKSFEAIVILRELNPHIVLTIYFVSRMRGIRKYRNSIVLKQNGNYNYNIKNK